MIAVIGTRGFPDVQGGVERHCEELYTRLAARGFRIVVFSRSPYVPRGPRWSSWQGISFRKLWVPRSTGLEAICHSVAAVLLARANGAEIAHIHAIGPGLVVPLARMLGMRVVFTHHGRDYMRDKWGSLAKAALRTGERWAIRYAHTVLAVSREVVAWLEEEFGRQATYAPNGIAVEPCPVERVNDALASFRLKDQAYAISVARLVPEKGVHDLVDAVEASPSIETLVVVGGEDHRSSYAAGLRARASDRVRFLGVQPHDVTLDLVRGARLFVLPSYHEGLPIALLEAMACRTPVVASSIPPHREVVTEGVDGWLAPAGDVEGLRSVLQRVWGMSEPERRSVAERARASVAERFSWDRTVDAVAGVYRGQPSS